MAELKDLLAGCTATDPAGIEAYINEQMKSQNIKMFLDDGDKNIFVPKSRLDNVLTQLRTANETITQQAEDIGKVAQLTKDNADAQATITKLQTQLTESQESMQKLHVTTAVASVAEKLGFILPAEDLVGFIDTQKLKVNSDGTVTGVEEALNNLKQTKPYLAKAKDGAGDEGGNGADGGGVPDYWLEELEEKADAIQQAMETAGRKKSAFLWYTDAHWANGNSKVSPALLSYLFKNTPMNKINFGGDIVGDPTELTHSKISYVYEWRQAIKELPNHHSVIGNHDNYHKGQNDSSVANLVYAFLLAPEESPDMVMGGDLYYYIDNTCEQTRYLYLDSGRYSLSDAETDFIIKALTTTPSGWHIVVISHIWFQYTSAATPTVGSINTYMQKALDLFDAYNSRQSGSVTMASTAHAYDFTTCSSKVEFCIGGHIHVDHEVYSTKGIPVIITASDANQERSSDEDEDCGTLGTTTEATVFGIIADYNNSKITVVGVGRGRSREISY